MYPRDDAFLSIVSDEVVHQVQRLMYHPSIILVLLATHLIYHFVC